MLNRRRQLFEIQDQAWCPRAVRDGVTDYLHFSLQELAVYQPLLPILEKLCRQAGTRQFVDLCSGGGGPINGLLDSLNRQADSPYRACLTDLYPNLDTLRNQARASDGLVTFVERSMDARKVDPGLRGVRTLFSSFHHFADRDARAILADAYAGRQAIGVFEFTQRRWLSFLLTVPSAFLMPLFTPFVRPWKASRLLFTYLIPLIPLVTLVDIVASVLRTRTPDELLALTEGLEDPAYEWRAGSFDSTLRLGIVYLIGYPRSP